MAKKSNKRNSRNKNKSAPPSKKTPTTIFWIIGSIALLIAAIMIIGNYSNDQLEAADIDYTNQPFKGQEAAPVKIVEFGDYKCPACKSFHETFLPLIEKEFIESGRASFYFMHYPFIHVDSLRAAQFAETVYLELGNEIFWQFHNLMYLQLPVDTQYENLDILTEDVLMDMLMTLVTVDEAKQVLESFQEGAYEDALKVDQELTQRLGVRGTPVIYINGHRFDGETFTDFTEAVEKAEQEQGRSE